MSILALTLACFLELGYMCPMTGHSNGAEWADLVLDTVIDPLTEEEYMEIDKAIKPLVKGDK